MLQQMFDVTSTRFHAAMQTLSIVVAETCESIICYQEMYVRCPAT